MSPKQFGLFNCIVHLLWIVIIYQINPKGYSHVWSDLMRLHTNLCDYSVPCQLTSDNPYRKAFGNPVK